MSENDRRPAESRRGRGERKSRSLRRLIPGWKNAVIAGLVATVLIVGSLGYFALTLPISDEARPVATGHALVLEDREGEVFDMRGVFRGDTVALSDLPPHVPAAVIAVEDRRFYGHFGIDPIGVARAAVANLSAGQIRQGGSTITQQLARVLYLSSERTLTRKIHELMIALWLEARLTKDEILARYLNEVYFGGGAYGIDGAARRYFGKPAAELTLGEAAMLAGLVKAPSALAPTANMEGARERAAIVLNAMVETGAATPKAAAEALEHPPTLAVDTETEPGRHYFSDWVGRQVGAVLNPAPGSLDVVTTLDPTLQDLAERVLVESLEERGAELGVGQGGLIAMEPDGAVLAMVGGRDYEESQFNRATRAERQPGSLFKIFVYLAALDAGFEPGDTLVDKPVAIDGWTPQNYSERYRGPVTLETALAKSINSIAVQLAGKVGIDNVIAMARRLGVSADLRRDLSLALGTSEVTLLEMTGAFAGVANGGRLVTPYGIVEARKGERVVYRHGKAGGGMAGGAGGEAVLPWKRDQMLKMMRAVVTSGTGRRAAFDWPAAGKSGTSQDHRDAWFIGFTDHLITGVWVGNDDNSPTNGLTGGGLPAGIWRDFMAEAHVLKEFPRPRREKPAAPAAATARVEPRAERRASPPPPSRGTSFERDLRRLGDAILSIFD